jgi:hypothetical protein
LPAAVRVHATRVSIATVPIRLPSSLGSSRTATVRRSSSERVDSGNSGGAGTSGDGSTTATPAEPVAGRGGLLLPWHATSATTQSLLTTTHLARSDRNSSLRNARATVAFGCGSGRCSCAMVA